MRHLVIGLAAALAATLPVSAQDINAEQALDDLRALTTDEMDGRRTGTQGAADARAYISERFFLSGLMAFGDTWEQAFTYSPRRSAEELQGINLVGYHAGSGGADNGPVIVVTAHYDHLGNCGGQICNGADDNASGVAGMLEVAACMVADTAAGDFAPRRDIVFAAWSGEELGLLGSDHYVKELADGKEAITDQISSYFNLDMVGRLRSNLVVSGAGSSSVWYDAVEQANASIGLPIIMQKDSYLPTDATSFYLKQVPIFSVFSGVHSEYHTPRDTADLLNYAGAARISELVHVVASDVATWSTTPDYIAMEQPAEEGGRGVMRAYLGTVPDYAESDVKGMVLNGVTKGAPADKAGLKGGDVIVEMAGKTIENIYDYTYAIQALKIGEAVEVVVERDGERVTLQITPESRQ